MPDDTAAGSQQLAVIQPSRLPWSPIFAERYGVDPASWKALVEAVFPAARTADAVSLALSYCKARKLDPFKRVVHIVPVWDEELGREVETVWPGIAEHRTTAMRTGLYAGADPAQYGPEIEKTFSGNTKRGPVSAKVKFPQWCQVTVYRLAGGQRVPVPGPRVYWEETFSQLGRAWVPNKRWQRAPFQMIEKCAEAAALRRAFPEEIGEESTAEEQRFTIDHSETPISPAEPEPQRPAIEHREPAPSFAIIDADGEEHEFEDPARVEQALGVVFDDAAKRGQSALAAAAENNSAALTALRNAGHGDAARRIAAHWRELHDGPQQASRSSAKRAGPGEASANEDAPAKPPRQGDPLRLHRALAGLAVFDNELLGGRDWQHYTARALKLVAAATPEEAQAVRTAELPVMQELKRSDGDQWRRIADALAEKGKGE